MPLPWWKEKESGKTQRKKSQGNGWKAGRDAGRKVGEEEKVEEKMAGAPGWLSRLSVRLRLRS